MEYQCPKCETIFENKKYLTEYEGMNTCPICETIEEVYEISNQVERVVIPKIAVDSGLPRYDELAKLWNEGKLTPTELACKMWNGGYNAGCEDTESNFSE